MKRTIALFFLIIALLGGVKAQTPGENFDVTHYGIFLSDFNFTDHTLQGEASVTLHATASTNTIVLELKTLTVNNVLCVTPGFGINSFNQNGDLLVIQLSQPLAVGQEITLSILYGGNTFNENWGGIHWWGDYVYNLGVGFDSQPHNLGKTWFPCVDNFTDKATYDLYMTVSNDKKAICGGNHVETTNNGDGTSTWHWLVPQEVATYHVSFTIGDYEVWEDVYNGIERDIPVEVYVKPAQINNVPGTFVHVKDIAAFYEENFGPYPFNRIGYICTSKGCMEHIDNIALTPGVITGNTTQEEYVAHELSHMYFGNKTTCSTAEDMWLNEGFAQFCGLFYRAGIYGEDDFQQAMSSLTNTIVTWCRNENNWIPLNNMPQDMTYDSDAVYDRGAVIVNTMMNYMGRENFLNGIRHYLENYAFSTASSEQLRDALTEATGIDMNGFFDNYVFIGGMPHYAVNLTQVTPNGNLFDAHIRMGYWHYGPSHVGQNNRVEVTFIGANGELHTELVGWDGLEDETIVSLEFEPIAAFADYYNHFLDAKTEKRLMATQAGSVSTTSLVVNVNSVSDSTLIYAEHHLVGPEDDPGIIGLNLSTNHYWNVFRNDFGDADVSGRFTFNFSASQDGDIIHTENDSAVLLYRANVNETWHSIPYTQEGTWKIGRFNVSNLQTGQYVVAAIDKTVWSVNENNTQILNIYPIPAQGILYIETVTAQSYSITNLKGHTLMTGTTEGQIDVSTLPSGTYLIQINGATQKFIIQ